MDFSSKTFLIKVKKINIKFFFYVIDIKIRIFCLFHDNLYTIKNIVAFDIDQTYICRKNPLSRDFSKIPADFFAKKVEKIRRNIPMFRLLVIPLNKY